MPAISIAERALARAGLTSSNPVHDSARAFAPSVPALRRVIAITDLSPAGTNAAWRAALIARDRRVPLHVLSIQSSSAAQSEAQTALEWLARELRDRLHIATTAQALRGELLREGVQGARSADLLVIPAVRGNPLADWILAIRAQRLVSRCATPVLVVRRPAFSSYRKVVVPVDLDAAASTLIAAAKGLSRDPAMTVLHVLCTRHEEIMWMVDVPKAVIRSRREAAAECARSTLVEVIASAGALQDGAVPAVAFGDVASRVLQKELSTSAQLLVLGKRPRPALADLLARGVTQRVLCATHADALVVPLTGVTGPAAPGGNRDCTRAHAS